MGAGEAVFATPPHSTRRTQPFSRHPVYATSPPARLIARVAPDPLPPPCYPPHAPWMGSRARTGRLAHLIQVLLNDTDPLWARLRHLHIADLTTLLHSEYTEFLANNKDSAELSKKGGDIRSMAQGIKGMPKFQEATGRYSLHIHITSELVRKYNGESCHTSPTTCHPPMPALRSFRRPCFAIASYFRRSSVCHPSPDCRRPVVRPSPATPMWPSPPTRCLCRWSITGCHRPTLRDMAACYRAPGHAALTATATTFRLSGLEPPRIDTVSQPAQTAPAPAPALAPNGFRRGAVACVTPRLLPAPTRLPDARTANHSPRPARLHFNRHTSHAMGVPLATRPAFYLRCLMPRRYVSRSRSFVGAEHGDGRGLRRQGLQGRSSGAQSSLTANRSPPPTRG